MKAFQGVKIILFIVFLYIAALSPKVVCAQETLGNSYMHSVQLTTADGKLLDHAIVGTAGEATMQLVVPEGTALSPASTLTIMAPEQIQFLKDKTVVLKDGNNDTVGTANTTLDSLELTFTKAVPPGEKVVISSVLFLIRPDSPLGTVNIDFGNTVQKKVTISPFVSNNFTWLPDPTLVPITEVANWVQDMPFYNLFAVRAHVNQILTNNPDYKGVSPTDAYLYQAYYFYGQDSKGLYLDDYVAVCVDLFHTIGLYQASSDLYSQLTDYIEADAVEHINLSMQMAATLAQKNGMIVDSKNGTQQPIHYSNDEQRAYMFAGQLINWILAASNNKNPIYNLPNLSYADFDIVNTSNSKEDVDYYINQIENLITTYKDFSYVSEEPRTVTVDQEETLWTIPSSQNDFIHYIDKDASENLDLLKGITDSDYTNLTNLTVTPNKDFGGKIVKIVLKKKTLDFWNQPIEYTGLYNEHSQYKEILGLPISYQQQKIITLNMEPSTDIIVDKKWVDNENQLEKRPTEINIRLLADGEEIKQATITEENGWTYEFLHLPKEKNGKEIAYEIVEDTVPYYSTEITGFHLLNTYIPDKTSVKVTKKWEDNHNQQGKRPEGINVQLYANGEKQGDEVTLDENNHWSYVWNNLEEQINNQEILYTVEETTKIPEYTTGIHEEENTTFIITNTYQKVAFATNKDTYPSLGSKKNNQLLIIGVLLLGGTTIALIMKRNDHSN